MIKLSEQEIRNIFNVMYDARELLGSLDHIVTLAELGRAGELCQRLWKQIELLSKYLPEDL